MDPHDYQAITPTRDTPVDFASLALRLHCSVDDLVSRLLENGEASPTHTTAVDTMHHTLHVHRSPRHSPAVSAYNFCRYPSACGGAALVRGWAAFVVAWESHPGLLGCFVGSEGVRCYLTEWLLPPRPTTHSSLPFLPRASLSTKSGPPTNKTHSSDYMQSDPRDDSHTLLAIAAPRQEESSSSVTAAATTTSAGRRLPRALRSVVAFDSPHVRLDVEYHFPTVAYFALGGFVVCTAFVMYGVVGLYDGTPTRGGLAGYTWHVGAY